MLLGFPNISVPVKVAPAALIPALKVLRPVNTLEPVVAMLTTAPVAPLTLLTPLLSTVTLLPLRVAVIAFPATTVSPVTWKAAARSTAPAPDTVNLVALNEATPVTLEDASGTAKDTAPVVPLKDLT